MTSAWPPLDVHAHVAVDLDSSELLGLRAVIFAATRSLDEARTALARQPRDLLTTWGVGVHPGVAEALHAYDPEIFRSLVAQSALVSEVGLDGKVPSRLELQRQVLRDILAGLQKLPRIVSLHSFGATAELLDELELRPIRGAVLHWWKGDASTTERALALGCYFSINAANLRDLALLDRIPLDRLLPETDHPDGDRRSRGPRRPGAVDDVEQALARRHGIDQSTLRHIYWQNLRRLTDEVGVGQLLPGRIAAILRETP